MRVRPFSALLPLTALSLAAAAALVGCADAIPPGTTPAASPVAPGGGDALVTFVRPESSCDTGEWAIVVDERGHFVANVSTQTQVSYVTTPGEHIFYAWSNDDVDVDINPNYNAVAAVRLNLVAGQSHYVAVEVTSPCSVRSNFELHAVAGKGAGWEDLEKWLTKAKPMTCDRAVGQSLLELHPRHLQRHLRLGHRKLALLEVTHGISGESEVLLDETAATMQ
jgi:hypothetical protein